MAADGPGRAGIGDCHGAGGTRTVAEKAARRAGESRDWLTVKFNLRFVRDTDIEKLRKAAKKIGQEMLEVPEIKSEVLAGGVGKWEESPESLDSSASAASHARGKPVGN